MNVFKNLGKFRPNSLESMILKLRESSSNFHKLRLYLQIVSRAFAQFLNFRPLIKPSAPFPLHHFIILSLSSTDNEHHNSLLSIDHLILHSSFR